MSTIQYRSQRFVMSALAIVVVTGVLWTASRPTGATQSADASASARLLAGTIDIHVHAAPDNVPRSIEWNRCQEENSADQREWRN